MSSNCRQSASSQRTWALLYLAARHYIFAIFIQYIIKYKSCTGWAKKLHTTFCAITVPTLNNFSYFLANIQYGKFETGRCIVTPPNMVYVTTLPCKISNHNFCRFFTHLLPLIHCQKEKSLLLNPIHVSK